ncbi:MAG TPA: PQQ-binding-like beta-propeller repeat protein [Solirubrobacteraceae bacterium]|nr:PQQ-binding-like beta-propeller repeat protein [Solirubrobacteraceae bacterium]
MRFLPRRPLWRVLLGLGIVALAVVVAGVVIVLSKPGNVSHPNVQFTAPRSTTTTTSTRRARAVAPFSWPWYGYNAARTRDFAAPANLRPPLHVGWAYHSGALLEFPPSIHGDHMFFLDDSGDAKEIDTRTGKIGWSRRVGTLAAATPAVDARAGVVLMPVLSDHGSSPGNGRFVALAMRNGHVRWSRPLAAGSESSPIVHGNTVYFGDSGGTLYAVNVANGHVRWTYHASGAIKGGPALWHGVLFFGDYAGRAYAVRASNGHEVWAVSTEGAHFGFGSGQFYTTPAVAYGRVYMGNTDGRMYSFGARNGALAWATGTGGYVYSSAAVADPRGLGPTVYAGSYDGYFYAWDARSGRVRWRHWAGGKISGSATVIGNDVYYADLATHTSAGLDARTGARVFSFPDGAFTPVIADEHAIFLIGHGSIYELLPNKRTRHRRASSARRAARVRHHASRHAHRRAVHRRHRR